MALWYYGELGQTLKAMIAVIYNQDSIQMTMKIELFVFLFGFKTFAFVIKIIFDRMIASISATASPILTLI